MRTDYSINNKKKVSCIGDLKVRMQNQCQPYSGEIAAFGANYVLNRTEESVIVFQTGHYPS